MKIFRDLQNIRIFSFLFLISLLIQPCNSYVYGQINEKYIDNVLWLIGTWVQNTSRGDIYEVWDRVGENELGAVNFLVSGNDTIIKETISLIENDEGLFYIPTVFDQNDAQPVVFTLKSISDSAMLFTNPDHDFPQSIVYRKITTDSLEAEISGVISGQYRSVSFLMKRYTSQ